MKRKSLVLLMLAIGLMTLATGASAERYLSNGSYAAYIGDNDYTYVVFPTGVTKMLETPCKDLLSMTDTQVYALTQQNQLYAISLNEANTSVSVVSANATQDAIDAVTAKKPYTLENGVLSLMDANNQALVVANNVTLAAANQTNLYFMDNGGASLKSIPLSSTTNALPTATQIGPGVAGALSMNASENGLVIVGADHSMTIVNLTDNSYRYEAAPSQDVAAGILVGNKLYYYSQATDGTYHVAGSIDYTASVLPVVTNAVTTVTATPAPTKAAATATPRPTARPTAKPTNNSSSNTTTYATVRYGNTGSKVKKMQKRLADLGYPVGNVDGSFGDATLYALNLFQGDAGYKERNYANSDVLEKLYSKKAPSYDAFATLKKGKKGIRVFLLQSYLKNAGYDPGTIDSSYGANTETAVKNFQTAQNIPATGIADTTTLILLYGQSGPVYPIPATPTVTPPVITMPPFTVPPFTVPPTIPTITDLSE